MNARMFAALPLAAAIGLFACAPALAQNATPPSSGSSMSHDGMQHMHAMKKPMHKHGMMMKKDSMQHGMMKKDSMHHMMKHTRMHHGAMMKKGDSMKMGKADSGSTGSGG